MAKATITAEPGQTAFHVERIFQATPDKVFAAMTEKEKLEKWWVGPGYKVDIEALDARDGGTWKFTHTNEAGETFSFHGYFHEVSPERIIQTFEFDGLGERGHVTLQRVDLLATPEGTTRMLGTNAFLSVADRDAMIASGMEGGLQNSYDALDKLLQAAS